MKVRGIARITFLTVVSVFILAFIVVGCGQPATTPAPAPAPQPATTSAPAPAPQPATTSAPAPAQKPTTSAPTEWQQIEAAAKKEGKVVVYHTLTAGPYDLFRETFGKKYPEIKIEFMTLPASEGIIKVRAEQASKTILGDIFGVSSHTIRIAEAEGFLQEWAPPEILNPAVKWKVPQTESKMWYYTHCNPMGIFVNTKLVPPGTEPKSYKDLTDPKWKNQMMILDPRGSGLGARWFAYIYNLYGEDYLRKVLVDNNVSFSKNTADIHTLVARGEYALMFVSPFKFYMPFLEAEGPKAPVNFYYASEGVPATVNGISIVKNAPHPNAAKLFLNFLLSPEGQACLADGEGAIPVRVDVKVPYPEYLDPSKLDFLQPFPPTEEFETVHMTKMQELAKKLRP